MLAFHIGQTLQRLWNDSGVNAFFVGDGWKSLVMIVIACVLLYLGIVKKFEPLLLVGIAFGCLLSNLPLGGLYHQELWDDFMNEGSAFYHSYGHVLAEGGLLDFFYIGVKTSLYPCLIFLGVGAMTDFGPLLSNPKLMLFGAAAQFGIFFTLCVATLLGFDVKDAASIGIIGAADGPTAIFVANTLGSQYLGAIMVAAYSYMALVPIIQPPVIRAITTKKERLIRMEYSPSNVSKTTRILFPIFVTIIAGTVAPKSAELIGFLMFGNLIRECGVLDSLSQTAQNALANLVTLLLGISVAFRMQANDFLTWQTLLILALGLVGFVFDTVGGVFFAKFLNLFSKKKINPMIGAAGISAFPMASRMVHKMGRDEDPYNFLLMHAAGANVSGQIASVIAGGLIITLVENLL